MENQKPQTSACAPSLVIQSVFVVAPLSDDGQTEPPPTPMKSKRKMLDFFVASVSTNLMVLFFWLYCCKKIINFVHLCTLADSDTCQGGQGTTNFKMCEMYVTCQKILR